LIQTHRYETGSSQPTPEALRKLAKALRVSADTPVFDRSLLAGAGPAFGLVFDDEGVEEVAGGAFFGGGEVFDGFELEFEVVVGAALISRLNEELGRAPGTERLFRPPPPPLLRLSG